MTNFPGTTNGVINRIFFAIKKVLGIDQEVFAEVNGSDNLPNKRR